MRQAGRDSRVPSIINSLRPYLSPTAPRYRTEPARPKEYPTAIRLRVVWEESNASPSDGRATLATDRLRLATPETRIKVPSTRGARAGAPADPMPAGPGLWGIFTSGQSRRGLGSSLGRYSRVDRRHLTRRG